MESCVLCGGEPNYGSDDGNEVIDGGKLRPPVGVAVIGVTYVDRLGVSGLELFVGFD